MSRQVLPQAPSPTITSFLLISVMLDQKMGLAFYLDMGQTCSSQRGQASGPCQGVYMAGKTKKIVEL
jgi:hypothetical protein